MLDYTCNTNLAFLLLSLSLSFVRKENLSACGWLGFMLQPLVNSALERRRKKKKKPCSAGMENTERPWTFHLQLEEVPYQKL